MLLLLFSSFLLSRFKTPIADSLPSFIFFLNIFYFLSWRCVEINTAVVEADGQYNLSIIYKVDLWESWRSRRRENKWDEQEARESRGNRMIKWGQSSQRNEQRWWEEEGVAKSKQKALRSYIKIWGVHAEKARKQEVNMLRRRKG